MSAVRETGERFVLAASPGFTNFARDRDRVGTSIVNAMEAGEVDRETAAALWLDQDHCLSLPLQRRYVEARAWDGLIAFHLKRLKEHSRNSDWPDALASAAMDAMAAAGRAADAIGIARGYGDMQIKRIRKDIGDP